MGVYFVGVVHISTVNLPQIFGTNFSLVGSDNIFRNVCRHLLHAASI